MNKHQTLPLSLAALLSASALLASFSALAQDIDLEGFANRYPPASITTVERAEAALNDARQTRAALAARHAGQEAACYPRFFVSSCIEQAAEALRRGVALVRPVEVEAERFKRQAKVNERDKVMAERRAQEEAVAPQRQIELQQAEAALARRVAEQEANQARAEADAKQVAEREAIARQKYAEREQQHLLKQKKNQAKDATRAEKEAANIAAYNKKQQAAKERQQAREAKLKAKEAAASAGASVGASTAASAGASAATSAITPPKP